MKRTIAALLLFSSSGLAQQQATIHGVLKKWHPVEVWFTDSATRTENDPSPQNPFLDYRLNVTFSLPGGPSYVVPGYFDGDGDGGSQGNIWKAVFAPSDAGTWTATASFRFGSNVAVSLNAADGSATGFNNVSVSFVVEPLDTQAPGFLSQGLLEYVGLHHLKFRNGGYFLKGGVDSPENFLGYVGFDNTSICPGCPSNPGSCGGCPIQSSIVHQYQAHAASWSTGDPDWNNGSGKAIIGALNYLASQHVNSVYFLPMNLGGDGWDTSPFIGMANTTNNKRHYDLSKLRQWRMTFDHATRKGILLHIVLAETEPANEQWLDGGEFGCPTACGPGLERKLFFRELVARFGHTLALKWNLSEENDFSTAFLKSCAAYIDALDVYDHPVGVNNHLNNPGVYQALAGDPRFDATALQYSPDQAGSQVEYYRALSAGLPALRPWIVELDENAPSSTGLTTSNAASLRKQTLWDGYLSGAGGIEWYMGGNGQFGGGDQSVEDFSTREEMYRYTWYARTFLERNVPYWSMQPSDGLLTGEATDFGGGEVFALAHEVYAVYLPKANPTGNLDLTGDTFRYNKRWYNPRIGEFVGGTAVVFGGTPHALGAPPNSPSEDWVCLFQRLP